MTDELLLEFVKSNPANIFGVERISYLKVDMLNKNPENEEIFVRIYFTKHYKDGAKKLDEAISRINIPTFNKWMLLRELRQEVEK